jgi:hypothetical protein
VIRRTLAVLSLPAVIVLLAHVPGAEKPQFVSGEAQPPATSPAVVSEIVDAVEVGPSLTVDRVGTVVTLPAPTSSWVELVPPVVITPITAPLPVDGDCESWRPLLDKYGIPFDEALPRMVRESHCTNAHNWNPDTGDDSYGPLQVNLAGRHRWWSDRGFPVWFVETPEGAIAAAAFLWHACNWGPWTKPYSCWGRWPS